jgi:hypothetical protein
MQIAPPRAFPFFPVMRWLVLFLLSVAAAAADVPPTLAAALKTFRAEGAPGWSFVQTSVAGKESLVEHYDASRLDFERWTLVAKDGRPATEAEQRDYLEKQTRRSRGGTLPRITESLDLTTVEIVSETAEQLVCRCRLKQGEAGDETAAYLRATLIVHPPSQTIERFELGSVGPFAPALGIKIAEMKTVMTFSRPDGDRPSLLLTVSTHLRGRAFWIKSLDQDLLVTCTEHAKAFSKR